MQTEDVQREIRSIDAELHRLKKKIAKLETSRKALVRTRRQFIDCSILASGSTNTWAGQYSAQLTKEAVIVFGKGLDVGAVTAIRDYVLPFFQMSGKKGTKQPGWGLFGKTKTEAIRFYPLGQDTSRALNLRQDIAGSKGGINLDTDSTNALRAIVGTVVGTISAGAQLSDLAFKYIPSTEDAIVVGSQPVHVDAIDNHVAEIVIPLVDEFEPTWIMKCEHRVNCTRMALARRRALAAVRLCSVTDKIPPVNLQRGDFYMLDASQPHAGPPPRHRARLGLYCNIRTCSKQQTVFVNRHACVLGIDNTKSSNAIDTAMVKGDYGVRTALQFALEEHPPTFEALKERHQKRKRHYPSVLSSEERALIEQR